MIRPLIVITDLSDDHHDLSPSSFVAKGSRIVCKAVGTDMFTSCRTLTSLAKDVSYRYKMYTRMYRVRLCRRRPGRTDSHGGSGRLCDRRCALCIQVGWTATSARWATSGHLICEIFLQLPIACDIGVSTGGYSAGMGRVVRCKLPSSEEGLIGCRRDRQVTSCSRIALF